MESIVKDKNGTLLYVIYPRTIENQRPHLHVPTWNSLYFMFYFQVLKFYGSGLVLSLLLGILNSSMSTISIVYP